MATDDFFWAGVIEGFYGKPWTLSERIELFEWMSVWGLNTYLYAPKDDLHHRVLWRVPYTSEQLGVLSHLISVCHARGLHFAYGLSPGLDIHYSSVGDLETLKRRYQQVLASGCRHFCLLFDDIPAQMTSLDAARFPSFAAAQAFITNELFAWLTRLLPDARLLFCPTAYCGRMASRELGGRDYLYILGNELLPEIDVFWTGREIISSSVSHGEAEGLAEILRRRPVLWDNLHANDYDGSRFYCGPYSGRDRDLLRGLNGIFSNPNCEFPLNFIPLRTFADFIRGTGDWEPRSAFAKALEEWQHRFETASGKAELEEVQSFLDCFYLPNEDGPAAREVMSGLRELLQVSPSQWGAAGPEMLHRVVRLKEFCANLAALRDRPLFHALCRRAWDLREEMDLLEQTLRQNMGGGSEFAPVRSDFHLPGTYRGGVVTRLRQLLSQRSDGSFVPSPSAPLSSKECS